jgi:4-coumarate--CoA ligase
MVSLKAKRRNANHWKQGISTGMTETAGGIIRSSLTHASKPGSIGTLGAGNYARIVDDQGRDTKHCEVAGELLLRGDSLMNGYYRNQDATNKTIDKQGWLHTGDQAYIDSITGDIFIVDRIKELIKYKGFQISPSELEAVLLSNDKNLEAAVVALKNRDTLEEYVSAFPQNGEESGG